MTLPSWLSISIICFLTGFIFSKLFPYNFRWFMQLRRPRWLTFERAIPFIWISIFFCAIASATFVWEAYPAKLNTWILMAGYLIVECAVLSYTPIICRLRSLKAGSIAGSIGFILGVILSTQVWQVSTWAGVLLLPYLLWSPIGTYVTWAMMRLNPQS